VNCLRGKINSEVGRMVCEERTEEGKRGREMIGNFHGKSLVRAMTCLNRIMQGAVLIEGAGHSLQDSFWGEAGRARGKKRERKERGFLGIQDQLLPGATPPQ